MQISLFDRELSYQTMLAVARRMLSDALITNKDLVITDTHIRSMEDLLHETMIQSASSLQAQSENRIRLEALNENLEKERSHRERIQALIDQRKNRYLTLCSFLGHLKTDEVITEFDRNLWIGTVDNVTVQTSGEMIFSFKNGNQITI